MNREDLNFVLRFLCAKIPLCIQYLCTKQQKYFIGFCIYLQLPIIDDACILYAYHF